MAQATQDLLELQIGSITNARSAPAKPRGSIRLSIAEDLAAVELEWRTFEQHADCTVFQSYDWLATWQRNIGSRNRVTPAIVIGRDDDGHVLFLLPLAIAASGIARRLTWLGTELADYNAPLLAVDFSMRVNAARFALVWRDIVDRMQSHPGLQFDLIHFEKMPETVGTQPNPFLSLSVSLNPSGAHLAQLTDDWETFYTAKRSSTTRRRDRTKRKRLSEVGEVRFVTPDGADDVARTLDTLIDQKARSFTRMGVANMFARPGYPEFYRELATEPATRHLVHVSRLDVGSTAAAINLGAIFRDRYYHLLASYDDGDVSRFGPGVAHLHDLLRHAIERGCRIFDFTIGDERYKRDWCDTELKLYDLVSRTTWRGALVAMPVLGVRRLKRWIKQTPIFWDAFCTRWSDHMGGP